MNQISRVNRYLPLPKIILLLLVLLMTPTLNAEAKWWIFGKSDTGVSTRYIYINDLSYDELGEKVTLYQESLPQGKVLIRGKGSAGKNKIGAVQISLDGKQSWQKAKLTNNGSFIYSFTPEIGQTYELYVKVLDTTGKSNDVDASRKELAISGENIQDQIYKTLDQLIKAYMEEDSFAFMRQVSDDFVSGTALLDSAIRQDFTAFDNIQLHYTLNNVTQASGGNLFVAITFSRMVTSSRTGDTFSDNSSTEFTFKVENGIPKIYSMKNPLVFGLSDADNIATGTINSGSNDEVLTLSTSGTAALTPLSSISAASTSTSSTTTTKTITITDNSGSHGGFFLATGASAGGGTGDVYLEINSLFSNTAATFNYLGAVAIEDITSVPIVPHRDFAAFFSVGGTYSVLLTDGTWGIIQIMNWTDADPNFSVELKYRYQPNGSTDF